jgi:hypothetical protein
MPETFERISREFYEINGSKSFVKFKANSFNIEKVLVAFVEFDPASKKAIKNLDVYVNIKDMLIFANDVLSGKLPKMAAEKAKENPNFPPSVFIRQGGIGPAEAKKRFNRTDGKAYARVFKFGASSKPNTFLFQGEAGPGKQDERGLIQMENPGKPEVRINVPCSADDLKGLCLVFQTEYAAFLAGKYARKEFTEEIKM